MTQEEHDIENDTHVKDCAECTHEIEKEEDDEHLTHCGDCMGDKADYLKDVLSGN